METMITINGEPKGKQRPRHANGIVYTPKETKDYEKLVHDTWIWEEKETYHGSVGVHIRAYFGVPKSYSKSVKMAMVDGTRKPLKKPDIDNIVKIVLDGLNGAAYDDDKQVVALSCIKAYSTEPRVEIEVREI